MERGGRKQLADEAQYNMGKEKELEKNETDVEKS